MKVTELRTYATWGEPRNWVFVKVVTDQGIYGWGEATLEGREATMLACVEEVGQMLIGQDPLAVEHHWQAIYRHGFWRGGAVLNSALAALDQALWDIRGKAWGVPVYRLLGGPTRERIRLYTHVGIYNPSLLEEDARRRYCRRLHRSQDGRLGRGCRVARDRTERGLRRSCPAARAMLSGHPSIS